MTFLTGKHLDRRTLLKGVGAALALPVLDAMRPAMAATTKGAKQALRVAVVYVAAGMPKRQAASFRARRRSTPPARTCARA